MLLNVDLIKTQPGTYGDASLLSPLTQGFMKFTAIPHTQLKTRSIWALIPFHTPDLKPGAY